MRESINAALKEAMKARDQRKVGALRLMNAAIKDRDIEARGLGKGPASDEDLLQLFVKMIKQRRESIEMYDGAGRTELADQEREEIAVIEAYLPKQMDVDEMRQAVADAVARTGAAGVKDMGKVMAALKEAYAGRMDFAQAGVLVKEKLK